ncbi:PH domain-containing protein [Priestia taiwanensis]|uniref:Uncharacterized protein YyaB-like PH domain-containing protein n=1 Tax=Priestia taiwanensis TaxID=1347902 RepID=A0A917AQN7_9BACI|nr:PH domain-containing protein [Priestia taiwanensis]MBM7363133.1 hypothetical protein [Priestia taiwanensis]GGE67970.1 hypothetical protein GCM10007140_17530 [Priestia taiwanensis]
MFVLPIILYTENRPTETDFFISLFVCIPLAIFCILGWFGTYYVVMDTELKVYGGFIPMGKIDISTITSIRRTNNPLSAPALSFKRLEITYGKWEMALVSPENETYFVQLLKEKNPHIVLDDKLR